ncbi:MAG: beta-phosphoglucomutase family hydrolase [Deltaproteobacteria bacterium]|jgi:beta-phosphoglucomutase family hydrolase|nr:beta-phosphoglucomutase family hydrolase [Deltaproteobacteria bacterium]
MSTAKFKGVIFDLDGVITGTARVHALAWESMFNDYLEKAAEKDNKPFIPFDPEEDYIQYVDGKPRPEGVKSFLESRGVVLEYGDLDDPPDKATVCGLGNRKNIDFQAVLKKEGPDVFESSIKFVTQLKKMGIKVGVASSSRNCKLILDLAGHSNLFATRVDGEVSKELKLKGKPDADIFVVAAKNLGLLPNECVVVEDAISGVQAGRNGNFGLTLGIDRNNMGDQLKLNGADIVIQDLADIFIEDINQWFEKGIEHDGWNLSYDSFKPEEEKLRETLCTVGNGYLGTRGAFEGSYASDNHYPGTYIAGIFNKVPTKIEDRNIYNNDFVNCPNWHLIEYKIGKGDFINPMTMELVSYNQNLNMQKGVVERTLVCKDWLGRLTRIFSRRIASMADPHICAVRYCITPVNYSALLTIRSSLNGAIINDGVARYSTLTSKHLTPVSQGKTRNGIYLHVRTNRSKYDIVMSAKTSLLKNLKPVRTKKEIIKEKGKIGEEYTVAAKENTTYTLEKIVSVYTSLDTGVSDPIKSSSAAISKTKSFQTLFSSHVKAWKAIWDKADIKIEGDRFIQKITRLHIYHMMVTASPHNKNIDAGMPARGLHGEAYRGHIFWDELYIFPFYNLHFPQITRALLMYRYRRLDGAREYAKQNGYKGAMYPWQTADDGSEETQSVHFNPTDGSWGSDLSRRQRHVSIAVFNNVYKYIESSDDKKFLHEYGAEIMLEIARFWASAAVYDKKTGRFHIKGVMGPDEFHEAIPGSKEHGITDNAYTNIMVVWLLEKMVELMERLPKKTVKKLQEKTGFKIKEIEKWEQIIQKINVKLSKDNIISQFDGYMNLKELDWEGYKEKYDSIHRMDRILKAEGDSPDHYKLAKQADVLMTFYVLAPDEVCHILARLGYPVKDSLEFLKRNYEYYEQRTSHGSTLSKVVHAVVSSYIHAGDTAWEWFFEAMESDVNDTQGGTTLEGIHTGVMAGTLDVIMRYFAGVELSSGQLEINPNMPSHWNMLLFKICNKKQWFHIEITKENILVKLLGRGKREIIVKILDKKVSLAPGETTTVKFSE